MNLYMLSIFIAVAATHQVIASEEFLQEPYDLPYLTWRLAEALNSFAFKLHYQLAITDGGNFVFSPVSIANTLGMLHFGAKGRTAKELEQLLGYEQANVTRSIASKAFRYLMTQLLVSSKPKQYMFEMANTLFINKPIGVSPTYLRRVDEFYRSPIKQVSFLLDGAKAVSELNEWVQKKTRNKINRVIEKLDPRVHIVSVNVAYFKGLWKYPFSVDRTTERIFYNEGKHEKSVPMMEGEGTFFYGKNKEISLIELPFKGKNLSAIFVLPHERDGLTLIEQQTAYHEFTKYLELMTEEDVAVTIPKFKISFSAELTQTLKFYGVNELFEKDDVNLAGMIPHGNVAMGNILHSTVMEISESGIETTSAKIVAPEHYDDKKVFNADHPFLFGIVDQRNGMFLFMGRVWSL